MHKVYVVGTCNFSSECTLLVLISEVFDKVRENLYPQKTLFWKILPFLGDFGDFCSISMANP